MNIGKTVLVQRTLIRFCREQGNTDMKFIGVDCVSAADPAGRQRLLGVDIEGKVSNFENVEIIDR